MECGMPNLYDIYYTDLRKFASLNATRQAETLAVIKASTTDYYFGYAVECVFPALNKTQALDVFDLCVKAGDKNYGRADRLIRLCDKMRKIDAAHVRTLAANPETIPGIQKMILTYDGLTIEEEEQGLRALATSKSTPQFIYDAKYAPRIEALKQLPSIMRLNCLETLTGQQYDSYNVFGNITDEEEFKLLLFSSTLKYRDRAEAIWNKYKDLVGVGKPGSLKVSGSCDSCGDFEVVINSLVVKTQEGLRKSRMGYSTLGGCCPFCGKTLVQKTSIIEQGWKR
jgi:hypothetical protein